GYRGYRSHRQSLQSTNLRVRGGRGPKDHSCPEGCSCSCRGAISISTRENWRRFQVIGGKMTTLAVAALQVADEDFLVASLIERCPKTMMIRELMMNALEARSEEHTSELQSR